MKAAFDGSNHTIRLEKGEKLMASLVTYIADKNVRGGWMLGIGGLSWAELGFYDLGAKSYTWSIVKEPLELLSLSGTVAWMDGRPSLHLHAAVADASLYARGGHLKEAEVSGTVELCIATWNHKSGYFRELDENTGLNVLKA